MDGVGGGLCAMNEIDDKIDYEPGTPEQLSFLKALAFLVLVAVVLITGTFAGLCAGWLAAFLFVMQFGSGDTVIEGYAVLSALSGFLLAGYFLIPRLHRAFYRW